MKYFVTVKTRAKQEGVREISSTRFKISVKASPIQGRANKAAVRAFAEYMDVALSQVRIKSGHTSKKKVLEIS